MRNRNFKLREQDYKAMQGMNEKQAGQFIKGLCGYAFDGVPMETKDAKIASAYAYAKTALDISAQNRENGRKGGLIMAERIRGRHTPVPKFTPSAGDDAATEILLKGIVLSIAEEAERAAKTKAGK